MKSLKNKLFEDLKLKNSEVVTIVGGQGMYTINGEDTDPVGGGYDKLYSTCENGTTVQDSTQTDQTDKTTRDKPLPPKTPSLSIL
jgi:hypothetical protein